MRQLRIFVVLACSVLLLVNPAFAVDLEVEHGKKLNKAPFPMRFKFQKVTGVVWNKSSYDERRAFLEDYYAQAEIDAKDAAIKAKEESVRNREITRQQRAVDQEEKQKLRNNEAIRKAKERKIRDEKKEFYRKQREQEKRIKELRRRQGRL